MEYANNMWAAMSDHAIIKLLGSYIKQQRQSQSKTQFQVAQDAGINRWTLSQLEKGKPVTLISVIQILRALDLLHVFDPFTVSPQISPIELAVRAHKKRVRIRPKKKKKQPKSDW